MNMDIAFFVEHAGFSYIPGKETKEEARLRCGEILANAEKNGRNAGLSFRWAIDPDCDSSEFSDDRPSWSLWECQCIDSSGTVSASLSAVDFGAGGSPWDQSYRRVVEAELAAEALS